MLKGGGQNKIFANYLPFVYPLLKSKGGEEITKWCMFPPPILSINSNVSLGSIAFTSRTPWIVEP